MEELLQKLPFVERLEFVGSLKQGDKIADGLHIVLQYSLLREGDITGTVLGTTQTFKELSKVSHLPGPTLQMASEQREHWNTRIWSNEVLWGRVTNKPFYGTEMSHKVADLTFHDLTIEKRLHLSESKERHLQFFLAGPRSLWTIYETGDISVTGEEDFEVKDAAIELNEQFPFEIEVRPWYFYDRTAPPDEFQLKTSVLVLHFKTEKSPEELSNQDFITTATSVAEDLIQLVSFLSKRWITWYSYQLQTNNLLLTFVRRARECSPKEVDIHGSVVPPVQARQFIKTAFTKLRSLRTSGVNLHMPLVYFVSGVEAKYLEEQFSILFLALERIKDLFAINERMQTSLPNSVMKCLRSAIDEAIVTILDKPEIPESIRTRVPWVQQKIPELNRPSLQTVLDLLFEKYKVDWRDLYPFGSDFTLVKTRNQLFHTSADVDIDLLIKELHRLQALLERILLSMLGWARHTNSPSEQMRKWLVSNAP
jgi:hypothetical protein